MVKKTQRKLYSKCLFLWNMVQSEPTAIQSSLGIRQDTLRGDRQGHVINGDEWPVTKSFLIPETQERGRPRIEEESSTSQSEKA